jgi:Double zinc ribbon
MSSAQCPQCDRPVTRDSDKFCTSCGSALSWVEHPTDEGGGTTGGRSFACPECREPNPASRLLCQRCGALLEPAQAPLPASLARGAPWRWRAPLVLLAIAAVGAAAAAVLGAALRSDGRLSPSAPSVRTTARAAAASALVRVDPGSISASASSELPPADTVTYWIRNTLDGDTRTAWNNHSAADGSGVGETLTYRFSSPVHLVRIDLVNGYAKTAELRADNGRIKGVVILTDRRSRTLRTTLSDTASRQRLDRDFGMTSKVTLRVTSIYRGARYTDLALSEIAFWVVPR